MKHVFFIYAAAWETSFSSSGKEEIINCYSPGCVSLESVYYTAYKTFLDGRKIFRELISVFLLYCFDHQNKYFSEQEIILFLMRETKTLRSLLQLFVIKIIMLV